jgi:hypothetical protein
LAVLFSEVFSLTVLSGDLGPDLFDQDAAPAITLSPSSDCPERTPILSRQVSKRQHTSFVIDLDGGPVNQLYFVHVASSVLGLMAQQISRRFGLSGGVVSVEIVQRPPFGAHAAVAAGVIDLLGVQASGFASGYLGLNGWAVLTFLGRHVA